MSHDSYLCGVIVLASDVTSAIAAIDALPVADTVWPFLSRSMFGFTASPQYRDGIIHFGASYKDIWGHWIEWEAKFEALISKFEYEEIKILVWDCYQGDILVVWARSGQRNVRHMTKIRRHLGAYREGPEAQPQ
jgi:hypothetical protein